MYNLGDQFKFDTAKAIADPKSIIKGKKYRITVLTERLVRLEYNAEGLFQDQPTELIWFRNFAVPEFKIHEDSRFLEITTKYFKLSYVKEKPFKGSLFNQTANLKVELSGTECLWYYGHPEVRNYGSPSMALDSHDGNLKMTKSLYSLDGFVSINDSLGSAMEASGEITPATVKRVDTYLFMYGKDFNLCLSDYYALTSKPSLIPRYALGNWWSRDIAYNDLQLIKLVDDFRHKKIPLSVMLLSGDWHVRKYEKEYKLNSGFTWNKDLFKAPADTITYLHSKGIRLGLNIDPSKGIYPYEEYYNQASQYLGINTGGIIPFNVMNSRFLDVYLKLLIHPLDALGTDFFWIDTNNVKKPEELFAMSHYHSYDMLRNYKRRPMILSRNGMVAPHRYPVLYSGKTIVGWDTLKMLPFYNSSAANLGVSWWSHDIGGYHKGIEDNELYIRYVQLGVFSPILRFSSEGGKYYKREPWRWNIKTYNIVQNYLTMRHRLIPYLYAEAYKYYKEGTPIIKPLYYTYPEAYDDANYRNEYYLGSELFVSPIITKKNYIMDRVIHKFFMPDGIWYDFVTGKKFPGGRAYVSFFKDQEYPVFAKAGAIIPFGDNADLNDTTAPKNMEIHIFPGMNNTYKLYEDDGVSDLYRKGFYLLSSIEYNYLPNNYTVIIRAVEGKSGIVPEHRNYKVRFRNTKQADDVIVYFNSQAIPFTSYVDGTDFIVEVNDVASIGQLTLNCKGKDIEIDAVRIINEDIETIISDLQIETELKEKIDHVIFGNLTNKKKRIEIRKLGRVGLERKFIKLFLKLLEYIKQV